MLANLPHQRVSVLVGQPDIGDEDVLPLSVEQLKRLPGRPDRGYAGARLCQHQ